MHHDSDRFRQIVDPFPRNSRFWTLFTQWVCSLAATPPRLAAPPPPNGGELRHPKLRHAGDTPLECFAWRKTPTTTGMENARGTESPAAVPMSSKSPATGPKGGPTSGTKLAQHTPSHRMSGTKFSLLAQNGSIWCVLPARGEFCTVLTTKKPSRESFVPNARQSRG